MRLRRRWAVLSTLAALPPAFASTAFAHGPQRPPAIADFQHPVGVGETADQQYVVDWTDMEVPPPTSTTTVDFFYVPHNPVTFVPGTVPKDLVGSKPIAIDVRVADPARSFVWDTSKVPTGTYWLWSRVTEVPVQNPVEIITFSPGVLTIVHPGDEAPPAAMVAPRDDPFHWPAAYSVEVDYFAFDPSHTGRVRLEASLASDPTRMQLLADNLPADPKGMFIWNTRDFEEGEWVVRATIEDKNRKFSAYDRNFWVVNHPKAPPVQGCACVLGGPRGRASAAATVAPLLLVVWVSVKRARQRTGSGPRPHGE